uniref:Homing endonuclease LAGLIDADG domain-containing protein n=1 Tax=Dactylella sp. TaxID=1814903 RepID=A0A482DTM2_9PEZI|nr:hypothetical protein [Dactylella sp.]
MVLTMHGFSNGGYILLLGFLSLLASMAFWFRDVAAEGIVFLIGIVLRIYNIYIAKAIPREDVEQALIKYKENINSFRLYINNNNNFGYYLAGLLEGDGSISLPALGNTTLNRVLNPRIVFTSHINNLGLYSGFTTQKLSLIELYMIKLPIKQCGIIVGLLLSDGWLSYASVNNKYPRLGFEQTSSQSSYVWFVYWDLSHYCYSLPKYKHKTRKNTVTNSVSFTTRSLPCLAEIYNLFDLNKKKIIPSNIYDLLTPVALAHMIMGDGSGTASGLRISTDSFSVKEVVLLINVLIIKYGLKCSLNMIGGKPRIYISSSSLELLKSIINPFIVPSMQYKLIKKHKSNSLSSSNIINKRPYSTFHFPSNEQKTLVHLNLFNTKQTCLLSKFARYEGTELILYKLKKNIAIINNKDIKEINVKSVISPQEYSIFIGLLLSHGWAVIHNKIKSKARIKFRQPYSNKEYLFYVFKEISKYCDKDPYRYINDGKSKGKSKDELLIATKWMHCFVDIYFMFYTEKNQKIVPNNIYNLLTPLGLAHWVKGGSLKLQGRGIILYTDGFNLIGVVKLINVLIIKYRLNCNLLIENNKPKIYIFRSSLNNLITIINQTNISILQLGVN